MVTAVFDTLKASRTLKAAGVADAQAEAIVTTMAGAFDDAVATKADITEVKVDISEVFDSQGRHRRSQGQIVP